jgi:hypothetical protein
MASILVMQIDSFLAAGFVIGFLQFQGVVAKMIRQIATLKITKEISQPEERETLGQWQNMMGRLSYFAGFRFPITMLGVGVACVVRALLGASDIVRNTRRTGDVHYALG